MVSYDEVVMVVMGAVGGVGVGVVKVGEGVGVVLVERWAVREKSPERCRFRLFLGVRRKLRERKGGEPMGALLRNIEITEEMK